MEVVLLILKIIGIVLLSIIGLILLVLLLVLFYPFSYRIKAHKDAEYLNAAARILWLLGLVTVTASYDKELWIKVRVLGIPVYKMKMWPSEEEESDAASATESVDEKENMPDMDVCEAEKAETASETNTVTDDSYTPEGEYFDEGYDESEMFSEEDIDREIEEIINDDGYEAFEKLPFLKKVKAFLHKIKEFILKCREKCYNIYDSIRQGIAKVKKIYKNIDYYIRVFQHPCMKPALEKALKGIKKLLNHIKPRHVKALIEYGSGDPASIMKVYGYYCMIYPFYGKKIKFTPDMENKVLNLDAKISGHLQMFRILTIAWSLFTDRNIRRIVRLLKREGKKRGRK
ncbi:MAG: DUF2953 domain-containing protein [Lachnospiraceae bacterium]|nr:DUF2953 domain-containing protein [Lachnospiraceae bacterium]